MSSAAPLQTGAAKPLQTTGTNLLLQRKCACGARASSLTGECAECGKKKMVGLQTKLRINEPGDVYEQEADRVAEQVLAKPAHPDVSNAPPRIQRFTAQATGEATAPASVDQVLASPGRPLDPALRQDMEQRFGHDFSRVRVHSSPTAEGSASDVNAEAYTVGQDIVFGAGRFVPGTHEGRRLLAHELTHVVQQSSAEGSRVDQSSETRGVSHLQSPMGNQTWATISVQRVPKAGSAHRSPRPPTVDQRLASLEEQSKAANIRMAASEIHTRAIENLLEFQSNVLAKAEGWSNAALRVGTAYSTAAQLYRGALEEDARAKALEIAIFSSVLTVLTAGGLAWLGAASQAGTPLLGVAGLKNSLTRERRIGTAIALMEDTDFAAAVRVAGKQGGGAANTIGQLAIGEVGDVAPVVFAPASGSLARLDPLAYQNQVMGKIGDAKKAAFEYFATLAASLAAVAPEAWTGFDLEAQKAGHQSWIEQAGILATEADLPSLDQMTNEFGRAMWAAHYQDLPGQNPEMAKLGLHVYNEQALELFNLAIPEGLWKALVRGDAVNRQLLELGIAKEAGMLILYSKEWIEAVKRGEVSLFESNDKKNAQALADWAASYRPKRFVP